MAQVALLYVRRDNCGVESMWEQNGKTGSMN